MTRLQHLLMKLAEEAAEVSQISLKAVQFGLHEVYNDKTTWERICEELDDLNAILAMIIQHNFKYEVNSLNVLNKIDKVNHYYEHSKKLGMVE